MQIDERVIAVRSKRQNMTARLQRFCVASYEVSVIVKNERSRCACFWFGLSNVSASGVGLEYSGYGHVPFSPGDVLNLTIDTGCTLFKRPIHVKAVIRRREESKEVGPNNFTRVFLGAEITSVDSLHQSAWAEGMQSLGDPFKVEMVGDRARTTAATIVAQKTAESPNETPAAA